MNREAERKRLVELFKEIYPKTRYIPMEECQEKMADYLLADGWMRPPVKVGDMVYYVTTVCDEEAKEYLDILDGEVASITIQKEKTWVYCRYECGLTYWHTVDDIGKTVFTSREEAVLALKGGGADE